MTLKEHFARMGSEGCIEVGGLKVNVILEDVKQSYGQVRYQVHPVSGSGFVWVDAQRFHFEVED